jgi:hypothetical protein
LFLHVLSGLFTPSYLLFRGLPDLRTAGGQAPPGDIPFTPEIEHEGHYVPVCGIGFWDNDEGASALCRLAGYSQGGNVVRTNTTYAKDAMPIGKCHAGEDVESCSAGENAYGDFTFQGGACTAGNPVGVEIVCNQQVWGTPCQLV